MDRKLYNTLVDVYNETSTMSGFIRGARLLGDHAPNSLEVIWMSFDTMYSHWQGKTATAMEALQ